MIEADPTGVESSHPAVRQRVEESFRERFGAPPEILIRAPGRVNLLGSHVDTSEGWVLPGAIDRAVWLAARPAVAVSTIVALDRNAEAILATDALPPPVGERPNAGGARWIDYPRGVAWALTRFGRPTPPLDAVFASDVPIGAGLSSSAAVEVAFLLAWEAVSGLPLDGIQRARLGQQAENGYLGVASGIMDQYASIHGAAGLLLLLDCRTLEHRPVKLPSGLAVLVLDSGVRRSLADSSYNDRQRERLEAETELGRRLPGIRTLRDVTAEDLERHGRDLPVPAMRRARHVIEECGRVLAGAAALERRDLDAFSHLVRSSHESSRDLFEVSTPELDLLAEICWGARGCHGARLSGGGFGGCVTALVDERHATGVEKTAADAFERRFARRPESYLCRISDGAARLR